MVKIGLNCWLRTSAFYMKLKISLLDMNKAKKNSEEAFFVMGDNFRSHTENQFFQHVSVSPKPKVTQTNAE